MPSQSDYQPLAQSAEEYNGDSLPEPVQAPRRAMRRASIPGPIDLSKLDNAFKRWTENIAQKVKRKKKVEDNSKKEIIRSVFEPTVLAVSPPPGPVKTLDHKPPMTKEDFEVIANSVRSAIAEGIHPKMITKGSSGSYFARAKLDGRVQKVAVFKPKDEEPYGAMNPKTTKWLHRQLRWIIPFGRACLIPNLSYISEAAASLLDERLDLHIVPRTQLVSLSSPAFFYDWIDRSAAKKGKPLPDKIGSMQYFLHGYTDATEFLRKHPWPGRAISDTFDDSSHRKGNYTKRFWGTMKIVCGRTGEEEDLYDDEREEDHALYDASEDNDPNRPFYWSQALQQSFRQELEKLVILDYLMLNTDRGADNYMIKFCDLDHHEKPLVDVAPTTRHEMPLMSELKRSDSNSIGIASSSSTPIPPRSATPDGDYTRQPHIHIAAIDNSLSFPHEHPKGWRSYTYGWLFLPVSIIGRPFSQHTREHFLPLLTSKEWWEETTWQLRKLFAVDPDFHPKMFRRQLSVIKGQALNIVQSLRHSDEGPLELTRRTKMLVWDDEVPYDQDIDVEVFGPQTSSSAASVSSMPLPRHRSLSIDNDFPPPMLRTSTDAGSRPVPFSAKFQRVHPGTAAMMRARSLGSDYGNPGTTGVTVLEHLERLDAVEASLKRLGIQDDMPEEETDLGDVGTPRSRSAGKLPDRVHFSPVGSPGALPTVPEVSSSSVSITGTGEQVETEEDLAALSKSMSHVDPPPHARWASHNARTSIDWADTNSPKKMAVVERLETVDTQPMCSCW